LCGRYSIVISVEQIEQQLQIPLSANTIIETNYNVAPTQPGLVILNETPNELQHLIWGLVPHWSRDIKSGARLINARRESIATKPSFRIPIRQKRCLVLADSFYEWRRSGGQKIPYRIRPVSKGILVMAGIWDEWHDTNKRLRTFSIITTDPNKEMANIHNRMPVLLQHKEQQEAWLGEHNLELILSLLQTPPDGVLEYYRVSQMVNAVRNNSPQLHHPVDDEPLTLF
jgi:putative SOS response-associated peptidase YedK